MRYSKNTVPIKLKAVWTTVPQNASPVDVLHFTFLAYSFIIVDYTATPAPRKAMSKIISDAQKAWDDIPPYT